MIGTLGRGTAPCKTRQVLVGSVSRHEAPSLEPISPLPARSAYVETGGCRSLSQLNGPPQALASA